MIAIVRGRRGGKTEELLRWLAHDLENRVVVTFSAVDCSRLLERCQRMGIQATERHFCSAEQARNGALRGRKISKVGVDNADLILQVLFSQEIGVMTATGSPA